MKFRVRLKDLHEATGLTHYSVAKRAGVSINTVERYTKTDAVFFERLEPAVIKLMEFYGLDWQNPDHLELIEDEPEIISPSRHRIAMPA